MRTLAKRQGGSSIVEFALVAPLLLLLLFAIIELGLLFWVNLTMQHAVREGARYAVTGQSNLDPNTANQQRYLAVIQRIRDSSMGMYDKVQPSIVVNQSAPAKGPKDYTPGMFGSAGDIIVLQLDCSWPMLTPLLKPFFPGGTYKFSVAATMRNEAF